MYNRHIIYGCWEKTFVTPMVGNYYAYAETFRESYATLRWSMIHAATRVALTPTYAANLRNTYALARTSYAPTCQ